jgi:hypothetical protein
VEDGSAKDLFEERVGEIVLVAFPAFHRGRNYGAYLLVEKSLRLAGYEIANLSGDRVGTAVIDEDDIWENLIGWVDAFPNSVGGCLGEDLLAFAIFLEEEGCQPDRQGRSLLEDFFDHFFDEPDDSSPVSEEERENNHRATLFERRREESLLESTCRNSLEFFGGNSVAVV